MLFRFGLDREFKAYSSAIKRDISRLESAKQEMSSLNLGGTAIGTGLNADIKYSQKLYPYYLLFAIFQVTQAYDLIDATQNLDGYTFVSGVVKVCAVNLSKISNDLRLMSSGPRTGLGEINLPEKQNGSSIMPEKSILLFQK